MAKLNQIIALVQGKKTRAEKLLTEIHHSWSANKITGISRTYRPKNEDGDSLPAESRNVQVCVSEILYKLCAELSDYFDVVYTQEKGNTGAAANITVNGECILSSIPVTVLLFLEKRLVDLHTFVKEIPTLPTDHNWTWDSNKNCYKTEPESTIRSQKVPKVIVKYEATKEHPAQTELITVDETVGFWTKIDFSGAIPVSTKVAMLDRVIQLQDAVKVAREEANSIEISQEKIGEKLLSYIFDVIRAS